MSKYPAFLFYPNDWLGGTLGMTFEEKGAYMDLLVLQFNRGHMTSHMIGQTVGQLWDKIQDKFQQDEHGNWYNARLDQEKSKRENYVKSRINNKLGANQYTKNKEIGGGHMTKHMSNHMIGHMENENENIEKGGVGEKTIHPPPQQKFNDAAMCYNVEEYLHSNQSQYEAICMKAKKSLEFANSELMKCHLHLEKNQKYPMQKKAAVAWFTSWLLNSDGFNAKYGAPDKAKKSSDVPKKNIDEIIKKYQQ